MKAWPISIFGWQVDIPLNLQRCSSSLKYGMQPYSQLFVLWTLHSLYIMLLHMCWDISSDQEQQAVADNSNPFLQIFNWVIIIPFCYLCPLMLLSSAALSIVFFLSRALTSAIYLKGILTSAAKTEQFAWTFWKISGAQLLLWRLRCFLFKLCFLLLHLMILRMLSLHNRSEVWTDCFLFGLVHYIFCLTSEATVGWELKLT